MAIITTENIYQEVMSHSEFYSLMYPNFVKFYSVEEQIIPIKTSSVRWNSTKTLFYYFWGWPGPGYNMYDVNYDTREILIYTTRPGWLIGKAGCLVNKYTEIMKKEWPIFNGFRFKETKNWVY